MNKQLQALVSKLDQLETRNSKPIQSYLSSFNNNMEINYTIEKQEREKFIKNAKDKNYDSTEIRKLIERELNPYIESVKKDFIILMDNARSEGNDIKRIKDDLIMQKREIDENKHKIINYEREQDNKLQTMEILISKIQVNQDEMKRKHEREVNDLLNKLKQNSNDNKELSKLEDKYDRLINKLNESISTIKKDQTFYSEDLHNIENQCEINFKAYNDKFNIIENRLLSKINECMSKINWLENDTLNKPEVKQDSGIINAIENNLKLKIQELERQQNELTNTNSSYDSMQNGINNEIRSINKEIKSIKEKLKDLENSKEIPELSDNINNIKDEEFNEMKQSIKALKSKQNENNDIVNNITTKLLEIQREKDNYNTINTRPVSRNNNNDEIDNIYLKISENKQQYESLVFVMKSIEKKVLALKSNEITELINFCKKMKEDQNYAEAENKIKNEIIIKMGDHIEDFKEKIAQLDEASKEIILNIFQIKEENSEDKRKVIEKEIKRLKEDIKTLKGKSYNNTVESFNIENKAEKVRNSDYDGDNIKSMKIIRNEIDELKETANNQTQVCIILASKIETVELRMDKTESILNKKVVVEEKKSKVDIQKKQKIDNLFNDSIPNIDDF